MCPCVFAIVVVVIIILTYYMWAGPSSDADGFTAIKCSTDAECGNWTCSKGICSPCTSDSDCVANMQGTRCIPSEDGYPRCVRCVLGGDCTGGKVCVNNVCRPPEKTWIEGAA